ncbi:MAG: PfkB family carbohydrate kinase [Christensenella sp.]|uniref:PfkB family carbohydrate kinase n=1 Tax=Christensenella sp. TaxID=1935934 RepID=UPI002B1FCB6C|nr:PfkB family carbohydrate kinase [Christensenella sp.]MEA5002390.1 PfkB family carbohydrate kinase [Christensenella sp.]
MNETKKELSFKLTAGIAPQKALIGFDGFVDEIVHVVDKRIDPENFSRIDTILSYSERLKNGCGLSTNVEIVAVQKKLGGNGPIFANALKKHHIALTYIGCVGENGHDPVFDELAEGSTMIGLTEPGHTDAYEFHDGKIIVSKLEHFKNVSWEKIVEKVGLDHFVDIVDASDLIGMENWTMLPRMSDIWRSFLAEVVPRMQTRPQDKRLFFDLADPEKRSEHDIKEAVELINAFAKSGFPVTLGLNKKEACEIAELYGEQISDYQAYPLRELCESLAKNIKIDCLVIHPVDRACCYAGGAYYEVAGPFCKHPVLTTGAGDTFNSGFVLGWMNGYPYEECLLCGVGASGYYVRNAKSPDTKQLADFLNTWD